MVEVSRLPTQRRAAAGRWVEIGDGVLARRHTELDLTVGLVIGAERCLMIDTRGDPAQGAELASAVRERTTLPWTVAITHAHFDHCFGTAAFLPCPVWAHRRCPPFLAATQTQQRDEWAGHYRSRGDHGTAAALAATRPVEPNRLVHTAADLDLGGRPVRLLHLGAGHTDHDLVVHVPDAGVVFAGDLLEQGAPPDFTDAHPLAWPGTLSSLLDECAPRTAVPGHGEPVERAFVETQRDALAAVAALVSAVAAGELDAAEAARRSPFPGVRWPEPDQAEENCR